MKKAVIRIFATVLALVLASVTFGALAESWECDQCGETGNTGNFCSNCGAAKPSESWECDQCGETGNTGNFCTNCGAAKPDGSGEAEENLSVNEWLEQIPGETGRVKVCLQGVDASGYIKNKKNPDKWLPKNAADGDPSTCWQVKFKDSSKGKVWLQLNTGNEKTVEEIWFKNGFWAYNEKGGSQYGINARAKKIRVSFLYSGESAFRDETELTLKDEAFTDWQRYSLGRHENVAAVRVTVYSKYAGSDPSCQNDLCLSEAMLVQNGPAAGAKPAPAEKIATVYESNPAISGAGLLMKLATRSGPGTQYDEPGTFFGNNWQTQNVRVLGKHWDGSIWWVLVDFSNGGKASYRVWTGLKRVDVDIAKVKEINPTGEGTVDSTSKTYRGPGGNYAKANVTINGWKDVLAYGHEKGYVEVEFKQGKKWYRLWVPEKYAHIDWGTDHSGEH